MGDLIVAGDLQWAIDSPCGDTGPDGVSDEQWARAQAVAVEWLWAQAGRKYGTWTVVFRPEWTDPVRRPRGWPLVFDLPDRAWASTKPVTSVTLPGPAVSVDEVLVDGAVLSSSAYLLEPGNQLVRTDGGTWYPYQDTTKPSTDARTWQISYVRGVTVPAAGQYAAGVLACDEARRMLNDSCRLPNNTTSVQRAGKTVSLDAKQLQQGYTGLREVDQWLRTVNPKNRPGDPVVWSPDIDPYRMPPIPSAASG